MRNVLPAFLAVLVLTINAGCASQKTVEPALQRVTPTSATAQKLTGQQEWERLVATGRQDGKVVVLTGVGPEVRQSLTKAFHEKTGIELEFVAVRAAEAMEKLSRERRAGLYLADLFIGGATTPINQFKPAGFLDTVEPMLVLPEVKDPEAWRGQKLSFIDKEGTLLAFSSKVQSTSIVSNTELVKPGEVKGYNDLLDPRWKGKIAIYDPIVAGIGLRWFGVVSTKILDLEYMRQLAAHEPVIVRDARQHVEWIAKGKYPLGVAAEPPIVYEFQKLGAPIKGTLPIEGGWVASGWGNVAVINQSAHPNATRVFLNWLLTKEGQTVYSLASGDPSMRRDVPTDHIDAQFIPEEGKNYIFSEAEDIILAQPEQAKISKEIFGALLK